MIIVDPNYVSPRMCTWLAETGQPVLDTPMGRAIAARTPGIVLVADEEAAARVNAGERLYTMSESALDWVRAHVTRPDLLRSLDAYKDKERTRVLLAPLYPDLTFRAYGIDELLTVPCPEEALPCVIKPAVGFLSVGVYLVHTLAEWRAACDAIAAGRARWSSQYGESVVGSGRFLVEPLLEGEEYAVDAYYDAEGHAHVLDILHHQFADAADTSDRLYVTGPSVIRAQLEPITRFLNQANTCIGVRDVPVHVELREKDGRIVPIEFNALRFAGLGGTEVSRFAYGFFTFDLYLNGRTPDWEAILAGCDEDELTCLSCLEPSDDRSYAHRNLDFRALAADYPGTCATAPFDYDTAGFFGFLFWKTSASDPSERARLLADDLSGYLVEGRPVA